MRRREFITLLGGAAAAWPLAARAQQAGRVRRIGVLMGFAASDPEAQRSIAAFRQRLQELGWSEPGNVRIEVRWAAGDAGHFEADAADLVGIKPDVILGNTSQGVTALRQKTDTIPIVFSQVTDPVGQGFVANLAHPGGNVTGFSSFEPEMAGKWLELLKEIAPGIARVVFIFNPRTASYAALYLRSIKALAPSLAVELSEAPVLDEAEIDSAMAAHRREPGAGLIVAPDVFNISHRRSIIALAARYRLPAVYTLRLFASDGGLIAYGYDVVDQFRQAALYVDHILRGVNPGDLPVQQPTKFELVINLITAKALGLTVPSHLQQRADEVIE